MESVILASASPRRKQILEMCNISFKVIVPEVDENFQQDIKPNELVMSLSKKKAIAILEKTCTNNIILAADTVVALKGEILTKPKDKIESFNMLKKLSGKEHFVYTGVCLIKNKKVKSNFYSKTKVQFYELTDKEIEDYIKTNQPFDKAGSYAIQGAGAAFVKKIDGDFYNVVGLPISKVIREIRELI